MLSAFQQRAQFSQSLVLWGYPGAEWSYVSWPAHACPICTEANKAESHSLHFPTIVRQRHLPLCHQFPLYVPSMNDVVHYLKMSLNHLSDSLDIPGHPETKKNTFFWTVGKVGIEKTKGPAPVLVGVRVRKWVVMDGTHPQNQQTQVTWVGRNSLHKIFLQNIWPGSAFYIYIYFICILCCY